MPYTAYTMCPSHTPPPQVYIPEECSQHVARACTCTYFLCLLPREVHLFHSYHFIVEVVSCLAKKRGEGGREGEWNKSSMSFRCEHTFRWEVTMIEKECHYSTPRWQSKHSSKTQGKVMGTAIYMARGRGHPWGPSLLQNTAVCML